MPAFVSKFPYPLYNGEKRDDPENPDPEIKYGVSGFAANPVRCEGDTVPIYPQVVKPPPGSDPSIRRILREVADATLGIDGHYRFYAYTDGSISGNPSFNGPPESGWANETFATVCTTFIWTALKSLGINLEGSVLEPEDFKKGAERDASTLDGLYFYTEPERDAAAEWLWDYFYDLTYVKAEWFRVLLSGVTTDLANEVVNCFANDTCSHGSTAWWTPGVGRSVSPDNIFFWDSPETGGVYGYNENLFYRAGGYRAKTVWKESEGVGTIEGQVLLNGNPVPNASVSILSLEIITDENGYFRDDLIPAGSYGINATKIINGLLYSIYSPEPPIITVEAGQMTYITLNLEAPPNRFRHILILGNMYIHDAESGDDDPTRLFIDDVSTFLSPNPDPDPEPDIDPSTQTLEFKHCVDDEVSAIVTMKLKLLPDLSVSISTETKLYDDDAAFGIGFSCYEDDDVVAVSHNDFLVPLDAAIYAEIPHLENGGDWVETIFTIRNSQQP